MDGINLCIISGEIVSAQQLKDDPPLHMITVKQRMDRKRNVDGVDKGFENLIELSLRGDFQCEVGDTIVAECKVRGLSHEGRNHPIYFFNVMSCQTSKNDEIMRYFVLQKREGVPMQVCYPAP